MDHLTTERPRLKPHVLTYRCDVDTYAKLVALARAERRSVSNVMSVAIEQFLKRLPKKGILHDED